MTNKVMQFFKCLYLMAVIKGITVAQSPHSKKVQISAEPEGLSLRSGFQIQLCVNCRN